LRAEDGGPSTSTRRVTVLHANADANSDADANADAVWDIHEFWNGHDQWLWFGTGSASECGTFRNLQRLDSEMNRIFTAAFIVIPQQPDWVAAHANIIS